MRQNKWFARFALIAGLAVSGGSTLMAADRDYDDRGRGYDNRAYVNRDFDNRAERKDVRNDYAAINRLRVDLSRDQARLDEDYRCGRRGAIEHDRRDIERDQRALAALTHDVREDTGRFGYRR